MTNTARASRGTVRVRIRLSLLALAALVLAITACVHTNPPTDVGNPVAPSTPSNNGQPPTAPTGQALSYNQDLKPLFDSDCVVCHGGSRPTAGYSMSTYANVMRDVIPGNPNSRLVIWSAPGGTMYRFWTGNAAQKANMVRQWVVANNAQQSR